MRSRTSLAATLGVVACGLLGMTNFATAGTIDAVSAASLKVTGGTTTATTAALNFTYTKTNGTWRLFYDVTDHTSYTAFTKYVQVSGKSGTMTANVTGLTPATKYFYWLQGYERFPTADNSKVHASFNTDAAAGILGKETTQLDPSSRNVDPLGRRVNNRGPIRINQFGTQIELNEGHR